MGIDVSLYKWEDIDYPKCHFISVPEVQLREAYYRNDLYATKILFKEAFESDYTQVIQPKPEVLKERLPAALEATEMRYRNMPASETPAELKQYEQEQKEQVTKFVETYIEEYEKGNNPIVDVSY